MTATNGTGAKLACRSLLFVIRAQVLLSILSPVFCVLLIQFVTKVP